MLESIPRDLAAGITRELRIPTIGIGAGPDCDGQILVLHDMIGLGSGRAPKFVRRYAQVGEAISRAVAEYAADVRSGSFPADEESFHAPEAGVAIPRLAPPQDCPVLSPRFAPKAARTAAS